MRVVFPGGAGIPPIPPYYDRTPLAVHYGFWAIGGVGSYNANVWTYTVPVNRRAMVGLLHCGVHAVEVGDAIGRVDSRIYDDALAQPVDMVIEAQGYGNLIGMGAVTSANANFVMAAADVLAGYVQDDRANARSRHTVAMEALEFDV